MVLGAFEYEIKVSKPIVNDSLIILIWVSYRIACLRQRMYFDQIATREKVLEFILTIRVRRILPNIIPAASVPHP
jgi:hypothetical protein